MRLLDALKNLFGTDPQSLPNLVGFEAIADSDGLNFCLRQKDFDSLLRGEGNGLQRTQVVVLKMLEEQGAAERIANGFRMPADAVVALEEDQASPLRLPRVFPGKFRAAINGRTGNSGFRVHITALMDDGETSLSLKGPFLVLSESEQYLLSSAELHGLRAWRHHCGLPADARGEAANLRLMAALQLAARSGMRIDLAHFERLDVVVPESIGVVATRLPDGSLQLCPSLGDGTTPEQLERRWSQLNLSAEGGVLKIENRIVLLEPKKLQAVKEVLGNRRIPADRVAEFIASPTAFLDAALVNLDMGFSVRVLGVGKLQHMDFGALDTTRRDWFGLDDRPAPPETIAQLVQTPEELEQFTAALSAGRAQGAERLVFGGETIDISDEAAVERELNAARERIQGRHQEAGDKQPGEQPATKRVTVLIDEAQEVRADLLSRAEKAAPLQEPDWSLLSRPPFPHQREGIAWISGLIDAALGERPDDMYRLQGALLADDMGLGKTYMTLVAASEYLKRQAAAGRSLKPILVVMPLSLLENWEDEVRFTFKASPFRDIVVLQSGRDLNRFRDGRVPRESVQLADLLDDDGVMDADTIRYALHTGPEAGTKRLDMDRRLVLTTYQTLRDYQFSLCRIDWGLVVFDEAQNIKNPNTLQSHAAKGLKADFKLLATGTPVENSLGDFWCLMDTAQPGLLGDWRMFREQWVKPIVEASEDNRDEVRRAIGSGLRNAVGGFMLRRIKEDQLKGLPSKTIHCGVEQPERDKLRNAPHLVEWMRGLQLQAYDEAINGYRAARGNQDTRGKALAVLARLREISLHPQLRDESALFARNAAEARQRMQISGKLAVLLNLLDQIRTKREKVILFMVTKRLQHALKIWLDQIYQLDVAIINGDTAAVAKKSDVRSRKQLIAVFEAKPGFNLLIMSPVAAGVGLNVIGANHVVHLERHWNPAKEAQASDRTYRIGQTRDVHIHLPAVKHPDHDSFDVHLDRLLRGKLMLKDAVVTPEAVSEEQMMRSMGL